MAYARRCDDPAALGATAPAELSRAYDGIFARYGQGIPVPLLRALGKRESNLNPASADGPAWGLLQVVEEVRTDYNARHGTSYSRSDLLDPATNVTIAANLLSRVIGYYGKHRDRNLGKNWDNPEFVKLLLAGWNSGYSETAGVGKVASYLEARGIPVTHDHVFQYAAAAGGTHHLSNPAKQAWQRSVADLYYAQPDRGGGLLMLLFGGFAAWAAYRVYRSWRS